MWTMSFFWSTGIRKHKKFSENYEVLYMVSGLNVNLKKSKIYGVGVSTEEVQGWVNVLGCRWGNLPLLYLGLPLGASMRSTVHWDPVLEKAKHKLAMWKARMISFGGWRTLVKEVLDSVSLYNFSLYRSLVSVLSKFESVRKKFFWGGCTTPPTSTQYCTLCPPGGFLPHGLVFGDQVRTSQEITHPGTTPTQACLTVEFQEPVKRVAPKRVVSSKAKVLLMNLVSLLSTAKMGFA